MIHTVQEQFNCNFGENYKIKRRLVLILLLSLDLTSENKGNIIHTV